MTIVNLVRVFPIAEMGGNPAPIILSDINMQDQKMYNIASEFCLESGFVLPVEAGSKADYRFRFFVPQHEMEMCGHATIGALWLLREKGLIAKNNILIDTVSGQVMARVPDHGPISISQPLGSVEPLAHAKVEAVMAVLRLNENDLITSTIVNACTSRTKTLVAIKDPSILSALSPDFSLMKKVCTSINSTGLYPFAPGSGKSIFHARQFPRASGYPEDAATGIAASALSFGLLEWGMVNQTDHIIIKQGEAMGHGSEITITFDVEDNSITGCWIHGICKVDPLPKG
tara:strand:- start:9166 stop:10026 length:861 start_codon:yes stop_codon:yes gene_type:complete